MTHPPLPSRSAPAASAARLTALASASLLALAGCSKPPAKPVARAPDVGWAFYGGDAGGQRFSPAAQITPANVRDLAVAWTYSTGEKGRHVAALTEVINRVTPYCRIRYAF